MRTGSSSAHAIALEPLELVQLHDRVQTDVRAYALYTLAIRGLGARELSELDIGDVTTNGEQLADLIRVARPWGWHASAVIPVLAPDRGALLRLLALRRACNHLRLPLRTFVDKGVERCHACREPLNVLKCPLFLSRQRTRLAPRTIREQFAKVRDELGLNPRLTFSSLRRTGVALGTSLLAGQR